ncbi:MAG: hypothetical protein JRD04_02395 [Deltaproteobacteria bacterium]|nr:hypothetical protein [Deltaproteobacteria bacterium]
MKSGFKEPFSYAVPEELRMLVRVGNRVLVPFNRRRMTGYVIKEIFETPVHDLKEGDASGPTGWRPSANSPCDWNE